MDAPVRKDTKRTHQQSNNPSRSISQEKELGDSATSGDEALSIEGLPDPSASQKSTDGAAEDGADNAEDAKPTVEFLKKRHAAYSRRNYYKTKQQYQDLHEQSYSLRAENIELKSEGDRLEGLLNRANEVLVQHQRSRSMQLDSVPIAAASQGIFGSSLLSRSSEDLSRLMPFVQQQDSSVAGSFASGTPPLNSTNSNLLQLLMSNTGISPSGAGNPIVPQSLSTATSGVLNPLTSTSSTDLLRQAMLSGMDSPARRIPGQLPSTLGQLSAANDLSSLRMAMAASQQTLSPETEQSMLLQMLGAGATAPRLQRDLGLAQQQLPDISLQIQRLVGRPVEFSQLSREQQLLLLHMMEQQNR